MSRAGDRLEPPKFSGDTLDRFTDEADEPDFSVDVDEYRTWVETRKAARVGYDVSDLAWYSLPALEALVEACVGGFVPVPELRVGRSTSDPAEGGNVQAALADVQRGLYRLLDAPNRGVLLLHYSGYAEASYDSLQSALTALQWCLGGPRPRAASARQKRS